MKQITEQSRFSGGSTFNEVAKGMLHQRLSKAKILSLEEAIINKDL